MASTRYSQWKLFQDVPKLRCPSAHDTVAYAPIPGPSGWAVRAGHRRASEPRLAPALSLLYPLHPSFPVSHSGGCRGAYSPPCICVLKRKSNRIPIPINLRFTSNSPTPTPKVSPQSKHHSTNLNFPFHSTRLTPACPTRIDSISISSPTPKEFFPI